MIDGKEFTFKLKKSNIIDTLISTYQYSTENNIYEKLHVIKLDFTKFLADLNTINDFSEYFDYSVMVSVNGNRFYLNKLRQSNGFSLRDYLIGGVYKLVFSKYESEHITTLCEVQKREKVEANPTDQPNPAEKRNELTSIEVKDRFAIWLNRKTKNNYFDNDHAKTVKQLTKLEEKYLEVFASNPFKIDFGDITSFIDTLNKNIWDKTTAFWTYSDIASSHLPRALLNKDNYQSFVRELYAGTRKVTKNTIFYGAPGTGKSHCVDQIIKDLEPKHYQRITFHPEFDNASFVGGYKPVSEKDVNGEDSIKYKFVPQAFTNIYVQAWRDLDSTYYLVIEEINRGNCAEIFGDIFALLDRSSSYTVSPSRELKNHLIEEFDGNEMHDGVARGLKLPPNLQIMATMNTSDQSLFPMDSAFKRRWEWEYIPICYESTDQNGNKNVSSDYFINIGTDHQYKWLDFIAKINNNHIKTNPSLGMDKCIGNYFIKPDIGNEITLKPLINKVIFYLWNDVFKEEDNQVFENHSSYEDFFPVETNGQLKIKELFERIELGHLPSDIMANEEEQGNMGVDDQDTL